MGMLMRRCRKHQEKLTEAKIAADKEIKSLWKSYDQDYKAWSELEPKEKAKAKKPKAPSRDDVQKIKDKHLKECGEDPHVLHRRKMHDAKAKASKEIGELQEKLSSSKKPRLVKREERDAIIEKHLKTVGKAPEPSRTKAPKREKRESYNPYRGKAPGKKEVAKEAPAKEEKVENGSDR